MTAKVMEVRKVNIRVYPIVIQALYGSLRRDCPLTVCRLSFIRILPLSR